jgi:hypothetical protein
MRSAYHALLSRLNRCQQVMRGLRDGLVEIAAALRSRNGSERYQKAPRKVRGTHQRPVHDGRASSRIESSHATVPKGARPVESSGAGNTTAGGAAFC